MTSKPSATNCPKLSSGYKPVLSAVWHFVGPCIEERTECCIVRSLLVAIGHPYLRTVRESGPDEMTGNYEKNDERLSKE